MKDQPDDRHSPERIYKSMQQCLVGILAWVSTIDIDIDKMEKVNFFLQKLDKFLISDKEKNKKYDKTFKNYENIDSRDEILDDIAKNVTSAQINLESSLTRLLSSLDSRTTQILLKKLMEVDYISYSKNSDKARKMIERLTFLVISSPWLDLHAKLHLSPKLFEIYGDTIYEYLCKNKSFSLLFHRYAYYLEYRETESIPKVAIDDTFMYKGENWTPITLAAYSKLKDGFDQLRGYGVDLVESLAKTNIDENSRQFILNYTHPKSKKDNPLSKN